MKRRKIFWNVVKYFGMLAKILECHSGFHAWKWHEIVLAMSYNVYVSTTLSVLTYTLYDIVFTSICFHAWKSLKTAVAFQNICQHSKIFYDIPKYFTTFQNILRHFKIFYDIPKFFLELNKNVHYKKFGRNPKYLCKIQNTLACGLKY